MICIFRVLLLVCFVPNVCADTGTLDTKKQQIAEIQQQKNAKQSATKNLQKDIISLRKQTQQQAQKLQQYEKTLWQIDRDITQIQTQKDSLTTALNRTHYKLGVLIHLAQKIEKNKHIAVFLSPKNPKQSMLGMSLLQHITNQIQIKQQTFLKTVGELTALQQHFIQRQADLQTQQQKIQDSKMSLTEKLTAYNALLQRDTKQIALLQQQQQALQQQVDSMENLLQHTNILPQKSIRRIQKPDTIRLFPLENTPITPPVVGKILTRFKDPLQNGGVSDGIYIKTVNNAQVIAPFDGYVAYVGAFNNLGKIVILSHERGYNTVMIGFDDIYVQINDWVLEKDAIGTTNTSNIPFKIEIRYGTKAENPLLWIQDI